MVLLHGVRDLRGKPAADAQDMYAAHTAVGSAARVRIPAAHPPAVPWPRDTTTTT